MSLPTFDASFGSFCSSMIRYPKETVDICIKQFNQTPDEKKAPRLAIAFAVSLVALFVFKALSGAVAALLAASITAVTITAYQSWSDASVGEKVQEYFKEIFGK